MQLPHLHKIFLKVIHLTMSQVEFNSISGHKEFSFVVLQIEVLTDAEEWEELSR